MPSNSVVSSFVLKRFASLCDCRNSHYTNCFIVSTYVIQNNICVKNNRLLLGHIINNNNISEFINYLNEKKIILSLEDLSAFFEFVVSPQDKEVNGAVYTPEYIREYIVSRVIKQIIGHLDEKKYADIACGCGGFLITLARHLHNQGIPYYTIFKDCLYGLDIADYSIERTRLMLSLLALEDEDVEEYQFNLIQADSLSFDWETIDAVKKHGGFDIIVGNPPYVSASKIDPQSLELVKSWEVSKSGKADMYIPFFQIGIENLVKNGILGYITVNNFYRSANGKALRNYMIRKGLDLHIIDFKSEQVFHGRSTYTCLCFVKNVDDGEVYYATCPSKQLDNLKAKSFEQFLYKKLRLDEFWTLSRHTDLALINKIRKIGIPLGKYAEIKNGFATLKNDIYVFKPTRVDTKYYYFETATGENYVEKKICKDAIKGNILRDDKDLKLYKEKLIFPYKTERNTDAILPIEEEEMRMRYPGAYGYLIRNRETLNRRSKSDKIKPWYLFGRSQALKLNGYKLLFPYIADNPYFIISEDQELMFYNGYCIVDKSLDKLKFLKKLLSSRLFWRYIMATSKPYGGRFYALAKNYIKTFGVIEMTEEQMKEYIAMPQTEADRYIEKLYGVSLDNDI